MMRAGVMRFGGVIVAALLLTACGSSGGEDGRAADPASTMIGVVGNQDADAQTKTGGTVTYATYSPIASLDPVTMFPAGASGGSEAASIYDLLVRYDYESETYEPQLAQDIQVSDDNKTWTLALREDAKFSDGSIVDADAVMWSINRYVDKGGYNSQLFADSVTSMTAPDSSTVVFELNESWSEFWSLLATGVGLVVAPSSEQGDTFTPIGAGPFVVDRFASGEELALTSRPDYWGGAPDLEKLRFVVISGDEAKADAMRAGGIDVAYLRSPETIEKLRTASTAGFIEAQSQGGMVVINNRPGRGGEDVRVRQAIVAAIDPEVVDQRVNSGDGMPGSALFQDWSRWSNDVSPNTYDPDKAQQLLADAKADGFDGTVAYAAVSDPVAQARALAVQALLQAAGFTVDIDYVNSPADLTKKMYADHDFDLASGSLSVWDPAPFVPLGALATFVTWQDDLYGVKPSLDSIMLFDKAFLAS